MLNRIEATFRQLASRLRTIKGEPSSTKYYPYELVDEIEALTPPAKSTYTIEEYITGQGPSTIGVFITNTYHLPNIPHYRNSVIVAHNAVNVDCLGSGYFYGPQVALIGPDVLNGGVGYVRHVYLPKLEQMPYGTFYGASDLKYVELGTSKDSIIQLYGNPYDLFLGSIEKIYVPDDLVDTYRNAYYWREYAEKIVGISSKPSL